MGEISKFSIESGEQGFTLKVGEKIEITDRELVNNLADRQISRIQELQLEKKREQYEKQKPLGFEYAPESAKKKREELNDADAIQEMKWIQDNVSYNADHTTNILLLKKIFCRDISGKNRAFTFSEAQELGQVNIGGYGLMTDYNDSDGENIKEKSDRYKLINIFSKNTGDTTRGMELFRDLTGCNNSYWTATFYKDEEGRKHPTKGLLRILDESILGRSRDGTYHNNGVRHVCGRKDME